MPKFESLKPIFKTAMLLLLSVFYPVILLFTTVPRRIWNMKLKFEKASTGQDNYVANNERNLKYHLFGILVALIVILLIVSKHDDTAEREAACIALNGKPTVDCSQFYLADDENDDEDKDDDEN